MLCCGEMPHESSFVCVAVKRKLHVFIVSINEEGLYQFAKLKVSRHALDHDPLLEVILYTPLHTG